jgi:hypothetical protein
MKPPVAATGRRRLGLSAGQARQSPMRVFASMLAYQKEMEK